MTAVTDAYGARAEEYADLFGAIEHIDRPDRDLVTAWAANVEGRIIDVGCGPGQWTELLRQYGCDVRGIDPTPAFVTIARERYPQATYLLGSAQHLDESEGALGGILAWYSLIHTHPAELATVLGEFARCVRPGGGLVLGFFDGPAAEPFDHAVTTAYWWSVAELSSRLATAGFAIKASQTRTDPGRRPHGAIIAQRVVQPVVLDPSTTPAVRR